MNIPTESDTDSIRSAIDQLALGESFTMACDPPRAASVRGIVARVAKQAGITIKTTYVGGVVTATLTKI